MTVLKLIDTIKNVRHGKIPSFLGTLYGLALPIASLFLKHAAETQQKFLFLTTEFSLWGLALDPAKLFWTCTIFTVAVSLSKVYSFLNEAYKNKIFSLLACIGFEVAFIAVDSWWCTAFFLLIVSIANIMQATAGFLSDGEEMPVVEQAKEIKDQTEEKTIETLENNPPALPPVVETPYLPAPEAPTLVVNSEGGEDNLRFWTPQQENA